MKVVVGCPFFLLVHTDIIKMMCSVLSVMFIIALMCYELFLPPATIKIALHGMDREMREEYLVVIQAKDMGGHMGGLSGTTTVTVTLTDINDNPPKFSKSKAPNQIKGKKLLLLL